MLVAVIRELQQLHDGGVIEPRNVQMLMVDEQ